MRELKIKIPAGMYDILPAEQKYFQKIFNTVKEVADFYGFEKIDTSILEQAELFKKITKYSGNIFQKEIYTLRARQSDLLCLRPEPCSTIARAYIEHKMKNLPQPVKLWFWGSFLRHKKLKDKEYRQKRYFGFKSLGEKDPVIDAQIIQIFYIILKELKFENLIVEINSLGDSLCRPYYRKLLVSYLKNRRELLCSYCKETFKENPLMVLGCPNKKCREAVKNAPQMIDRLCNECKIHFKNVLEFLDEMKIPYNLNPYLVGDMDFYTNTVFRIYQEFPENNQEYHLHETLVKGGRYDKLIKILGSKDTPAFGGAAEIELLVEKIKNKKICYDEIIPKIFLVQLGISAKRKILKIMNEFREAKIPTAESLGKDSLKSQLRVSEKIGCAFTLILGKKEVLDNTIILRETKTGKQTILKLDNITKEMKKRIKNF